MARSIKPRGGVSATHHKTLTRDKAIETVALPAEVAVPLQMHFGALAQPVVSKGDHVVAGQLIGEPHGPISAAVHASVDGTVKAIQERMLAGGRKGPCVIITVDAEQSQPLVEPRDTDSLTPEEIVDIVREAGIVGMGGAGFPTHVKLVPPADSPVDTFIVNGCECEPYLTCDFRQMLEWTDDLILGAQLIKRAVGAADLFIGIEDDKPEAVAVLRDRGKGIIEVIDLPARYPQGAEGTLIKAALGRQVAAGKLPSSVGALVQNVGTTIAVARACRDRRPLIERVLTVSGPAVAEPKNLLFRYGTSAQHLIDACGGLTATVAKVIHGGPMMGTALHDLSVPMVKTSSGLIALDHSMVFRGDPEPCIRCSGCADRCPVGLRPMLLVSYIEKGLIDKAVDEGLLACIECGSCAYGCPGGRPMVQLLRYGKAQARKRMAK